MKTRAPLRAQQTDVGAPGPPGLSTETRTHLGLCQGRRGLGRQCGRPDQPPTGQPVFRPLSTWCLGTMELVMAVMRSGDPQRRQEVVKWPPCNPVLTPWGWPSLQASPPPASAPSLQMRDLSSWAMSAPRALPGRTDRNLNTVCKPFLQTGQAAAGTTPLLRNPEPWSPAGPFLGPHLNESPSWRDPGQHRFFLSGTLG